MSTKHVLYCHHGLRGSASPVLTATGFVNGRWQFSTPPQNPHPLTDHQKICCSHARTVVRDCCKGDDESQWERGKFDPPPPKNPLSVWSKVQTRIWPSRYHCHSLSLASVKSRLVFTFQVPAHPGSPGQRAVKRVCVCVREREREYLVQH